MKMRERVALMGKVVTVHLEMAREYSERPPWVVTWRPKTCTVPLDGFDLGGTPKAEGYQWSDEVKADLSRIMKDAKRGSKGRWVKEIYTPKEQSGT